MSEHGNKALAPHKTARRIDALDLARGVALFAMASYHFSWDLEQFGYLESGISGRGWLKLYARLIAGSFLLLAGVSLALAHDAGLRPQAFLKRLGMIATAAVLITVATLYATPGSFIFFGILHAIGVASVIGLAFLPLPGVVAIGAGLLCLTVPHLYQNEAFNTIWLYWIGLHSVPPRSNDFVPLMPWLGPFLIGLGGTKLAIRFAVTERLATFDGGDGLFSRITRYCGRHSLAFYLVHQPVLLALVWAFSQIAPAQPADPVSKFVSECQAGCGIENEKGFCERFCGCVTDELLSQRLFNGLTNGTIDMTTDSRILGIAEYCTATAQP